MFTQPDGDRIHPQHVSDQFLWLAYLAGLPPIRLHDLRHGAVSLMLAAGVEIKVVQETLGHTSSAFTADTYTSVFPRGDGSGGEDRGAAAGRRRSSSVSNAPNGVTIMVCARLVRTSAEGLELCSVRPR